MSVKDWPTPWKVEKSPQTNGTIGWSVLDADDTEIVTVWDEAIARLVARAGVSGPDETVQALARLLKFSEQLCEDIGIGINADAQTQARLALGIGGPVHTGNTCPYCGLVPATPSGLGHAVLCAGRIGNTQLSKPG